MLKRFKLSATVHSYASKRGFTKMSRSHHGSHGNHHHGMAGHDEHGSHTHAGHHHAHTHDRQHDREHHGGHLSHEHGGHLSHHKHHKDGSHGSTHESCCSDHNAYLGSFMDYVFWRKYRVDVGTTVVDVGCGPTVHTGAALSKYFYHIYLAEYLESGRTLVEKWLRRDPTAFDWSPYFKLIAEQEGGGSSESIEERYRSKIRGIFPCDINKPAADLSGIPGAPEGGFDAVSCTGVISVAVQDLDQYKSAVQNVVALIKPGGFFIYTDMLQKAVKDQDADAPEGTFAPHGVPLNADIVKPVISDVGIEILSYSQEYYWGEGWGEFYLLGKKKA